MTKPWAFVGLAATAATLDLVACQSADDVSPASAAVDRGQEIVNPSCRPGDTPAGTASGLRCTPGSNTGQWPGIDANVEGASTQGQAISPPQR